MARDEKRRDPGEFYPGGKVWVKPGQSQPQLEGAVQYDREQTLTDAQKEQAQKNIGTLGKLPLRPLPLYLHALAFDDTYPEDAAWLYAQLGPSDLGRCSAVRRGGKLWRNYDWTFDSSAEFAVKVSGNASRFASVGMASVGARLTENEVASGVYSRYYRCLPGMTLDGINEKGVVCEINVDGGPKDGWHGDADEGGIHILAAVRWALDHGETAAQAAEWLADHIIQPTGEMNFHFMVADATSTYVVENGHAVVATPTGEFDQYPAMTNFAVTRLHSGAWTYNPIMAHFDDPTGEGWERWGLLQDSSKDISAVNFTNAYQSGNNWDSDFGGAAQHAEAIRQWAEQGDTKEAHRGKTTSSGKAWWQSVHTTEYDFAAKTMKVAVQETDEWFTFAVDAKGVTEVSWEDVKDKPSTFPPSAHTHPQSQVDGLAGALAAKRGMTDRDFSTDWVCTPALPTGYKIVKASSDEGMWWIPVDGSGSWQGRQKGRSGDTEIQWGENDSSIGYAFTATRTFDTLALTSEVPAPVTLENSVTRTSANGVKSSGIWSAVWGALAALPTGFTSLYDWCVSQLAGKLSLSGGTIDGGDLLVKTSSSDLRGVGLEYAGRFFKFVFDEGNLVLLSNFDGEIHAIEVPYLTNGTLALLSDILARIAPAFAAKTGTGAYAEGAKVTYNGALYERNATTGADTSWIAAHWTALADLSGVLSGLKSDGKPTDQFATDLLGKQVAINAIHDNGGVQHDTNGYFVNIEE